MSVWYTSDWHIGHKNIIAHSSRPFSDVDEMNAEIVRRYRKLVRPDDLVWFLGDVVWKAKYLDLVRDLPGRRYLVRGNHDRRTTDAKFRAAGFEQILTEATFNFRGIKCRLSHYPYAGYSTDPRYLELRPPRVEGEVLIHGHSHVPPEKRVNLEFRSVNVGVDAWDFSPVHEDELFECLKNFEVPT